MNPEFIPILADAIRHYYSREEVLELCALFDVESEFEIGKPPEYMGFSRRLVIQVEIGNNRRLLEALVPSLINRAREGAAQSKWDAQEFHRGMVNSLERLLATLEVVRVPTELSIPEDRPFSAKSQAREFLGTAETPVFVVDNWAGPGTLDCLRDVKVAIRLLTGKHGGAISSGFDRALKEFLTEGYQIEVRQHLKLHDRYLFFNERCWLVGSSLKDAGKKTFNVIECVDNRAVVLADAEKKWAEGTPYIV